MCHWGSGLLVFCVSELVDGASSRVRSLCRGKTRSWRPPHKETAESDKSEAERLGKKGHSQSTRLPAATQD